MTTRLGASARGLPAVRLPTRLADRLAGRVGKRTAGKPRTEAPSLVVATGND